ncbi:THUMP domain-containing protein 3 [Balamuthia mandrillaris]
MDSLAQNRGNAAAWRRALEVWRSHLCFTLDDEALAERREELMASSECVPTFRASCTRIGSSHRWSSLDAEAALGGALHESFGWPVSLKKYELEAFLHIHERHFLLGLSLTARPFMDELHSNHSSHKGARGKRRRARGLLKELGHTTLSPMIAHSLCLLAKLQPGQVVLDPFCGVGSIPIHAANLCPQAVIFGTDISSGDIQHARNNVQSWLNSASSPSSPSVALLQVGEGDARAMPWRDGTVDVIISDMPFGVRSGSFHQMQKLYPVALREMSRVVRTNGMAYLLTSQRNLMNRNLEQQQRRWQLVTTHLLQVNRLEIVLYVLQRTAAPYVPKQKKRRGLHSQPKPNKKDEEKEENKEEEKETGPEQRSKTKLESLS